MDTQPRPRVRAQSTPPRPRNHPAARNVIDRHRLLEQKCRISVGVAADEHTEPQAVSKGSQCGEHRVGLVGRVHDIEEP